MPNFSIRPLSGLLKSEVVWFDAMPRFAVLPVRTYYQSPSTAHHRGFVREKFLTLQTYLGVSCEEILGAARQSTRNEIRQALRADLVCSEGSLAEFRPFYNAFARAKGLPPLGASLSKGSVRVRITKVSSKGATLAMHALILDKQSGRVRLLNSATARFDDPKERAVIGKANRGLHWWEICEAKREGYRTYDWGGISENEDDPAMRGVNEFKRSFGGTLVEESIYRPFFVDRLKNSPLARRVARASSELR